MAARPAVAFLGLGALGSPMATNLLQAGFPLSVWNRTRQAEVALAAAGAGRASTPAAAAAGAELIALCLSDDAAVEAVLFGPDGVAAGAAPGCLVIDFSTITASSSGSTTATGTYMRVKRTVFQKAPPEVDTKRR